MCLCLFTCKLPSLESSGRPTCAGRTDQNQSHRIGRVDGLYAAVSLLKLPDSLLEVGDLRLEVVDGLVGDWGHFECSKLKESLTKARKSCVWRNGALKLEDVGAKERHGSCLGCSVTIGLGSGS